MGERQPVLSNHKKIANIIKQMSGQANMITVPRIYIEFTGDLSTAVVLNQIVYWSDKTKRTDGFFYKTYKEWTEEICLTERQVRYAVKKLKEIGFLETELKKANGAPTVHYRLDYDKLLESILTKCQDGNSQNVGNDSDKSAESLTKTTQKITQKNTTKTTTSANEGGLLVNSHFGKLASFYEKNVGPLLPVISQELGSVYDAYKDVELIEAAFKIAIQVNAKNKMRYADGVLRNWHAELITTYEQLKAKEARDQHAKSQPNHKREERTTLNTLGHDVGF